MWLWGWWLFCNVGQANVAMAGAAARFLEGVLHGDGHVHAGEFAGEDNVAGGVILRRDEEPDERRRWVESRLWDNAASCRVIDCRR